MSFKGFATSLFGGVIDKYSKTFSFVKDPLLNADIKMTFRSYMSIVLLTSSLISISSFISLVVIFNFISIPLMMKIVYLFVIPFVNLMVSFVLLSYYPNYKATTRRKSIETNLPFALMHMGAIAESGAPPHTIFRLMAEFEEYGELCNEMKKVVRNIDVFGVDPLTAIRKVAEKNPSEALKQTLFGFITTTESGGDIRAYLKTVGQQTLFEWRIRRQRFMQQLSAYAEFYTGVLIAAPLFIISLFAVMAMISPTMAGYNIIDLMQLSIYLLIPAVNFGFLMFLRGVEVEI